MNFYSSTQSRSMVQLIWIVSIFLWVSVSPLAAPQSWPRPIQYTSDYAQVLTDSEENQINQLADLVRKKTQVQIAVATVDSIAARGYASIEEAAVTLFSQWGIGEKGKDNGLLILVAVKDRKWRVEVGYGLEGTIPDVVASRMGRTILPDAFRAGRYSQGLYDLTIAFVAEIARERNIPLSEFNVNAGAVPRTSHSKSSSQRQRGNPLGSIFSAIMAVCVFLFFLRHPNLLILYLLMGGNRHSGHWRGGSHFGGGFGGGSGFGGFGGGRSGGGGASGGW